MAKKKSETEDLKPKMYQKNLTEDLRLRLSKKDMDFLRDLSEERSCSVSETIRYIVGEYRRSLEQLDMLKTALEIAKNEKKGGGLSNGDTETNLDHIV